MTRSESIRNKKGPQVWVKKWVDYSAKYGMGYSLSNGSTGVYFNDNTKILKDAEGMLIDYLERKNADRIDVLTTHAVDDYPKEISKKVVLLKHFQEYLEGKEGDTPR